MIIFTFHKFESMLIIHNDRLYFLWRGGTNLLSSQFKKKKTKKETGIWLETSDLRNILKLKSFFFLIFYTIIQNFLRIWNSTKCFKSNFTGY